MDLQKLPENSKIQRIDDATTADVQKKIVHKMGLDFNIVGLEKRARQIVAFENPRVVLNWNFCVLFPVYKEMMQNNTDAYF